MSSVFFVSFSSLSVGGAAQQAGRPAMRALAGQAGRKAGHPACGRPDARSLAAVLRTRRRRALADAGPGSLGSLLEVRDEVEALLWTFDSGKNHLSPL